MSEERLSNPAMTSDLIELESSLRSLSVGLNVNRDGLMFEAGRQAAVYQSVRHRRYWQTLSVVLAGLLVGQTVFDRQANRSQIAGNSPASVRSNAADPLDQSTSLSLDGPQSNAVRPGDARLAPSVHTSEQNVRAKQSAILQLRRVALVHGLDAAFSAASNVAAEPVESNSTQQQLLLELLGS